MADTNDTSLDDFFAKKDKSKKSKKKLASDPIGLTRRLDDSNSLGRRTAGTGDKVFKKTTNPASSENQPQIPEEEWAEIEEEEKDYTGLKIQNLQISELREEELERERLEELAQDMISSGQGEASGPWKVVACEKPVPKRVKKRPQVATEVTDSRKTLEVKVEAEPRPSVYVPPSMRAGGSATKSRPLMKPSRKHAPEINSNSDFPTLSNVIKRSSSRKKATVESVKQGSRVTEIQRTQGDRLSRGNVC